VWEHKAEVEPIVVLAFPPDDRVGTVRRCGWLSIRHLEISISELRSPA
jgi:hypothetical protein